MTYSDRDPNAACWICGEDDDDKVGDFGFEEPMCKACFRERMGHCPDCNWDEVFKTPVCGCAL